MTGAERPRSVSTPILLLFLAVGMAVAATGWLYYRADLDRAWAATRELLRVVADLKVGQIAEWRRECIDDARLLASDHVSARQALALVRGDASAGTAADVRAWLSAITGSGQYRDAVLVDAALQPRMWVGADAQSSPLGAPVDAREAMRRCAPSLSDFHRSHAVERIHLDLYVPLGSSAADGAAKNCDAALLLIIDPSSFLYPLIQNWPTGSTSAETLLVKRDDDSVLYLNQLRHRRDSALSLRLPLERTNLPAAMAVTGREGLVEGVDYRGEPVLAALRAVPESTWFMVAKMDQEEIRAPFRTWVTFAATGTGGLLLVIGAVYGLWWNRRERQTLRRQMETELQRRAIASRYEFLTRHANDIIIIADQNRHITEANRRAELVYGYSPAEFCGMPLTRLRPPDIRDEVESQLAAAERTDGLVYETIHKRKDDTVFPVEVSVSVQKQDHETIYLFIVREIGERKQREAELRAASAYSRRLIEANLDILVTISDTGRITDVNRATELVTGVPRQQLIGSDFAIYFTDPTQAKAGYRRVLAEGLVRDYPLTIRHISGQTTDVLFNAIVHRDEAGGTIGVLASARDITERKKVEEELRRLNLSLEQRANQLRRLTADLTQAEERERRRLSQMLHDHLQQLLVATKLRLSLATAKTTDENQRELLAQVQDLLMQSIAASRSLTAEISPPVLYEAGLVPALSWLARWMEEKHSLRVELDVSDDADPGSEDTRILLFRGARELLFNVAKHAHVDRATVRLWRSDNSRIRLDVIDQGSGFDPAERLAPGVIGFGLLSLRERLELIGGQFEVDSTPGRGAQLTMIVPAAEGETPAKDQTARRQGPSATPRPAGAADGQSIRVLLADDQAIVRQGLAALLNGQCGIEIVGEAADGIQAVELARQLRPDVVVMDVNMPVLDGEQATRRLMDEQPCVKVVALSAHVREDMEEAMRRAGAVTYLDKSGPVEDLVAAICACMV